jgi:trk system potassium uptake protein TrkH
MTHRETIVKEYKEVIHYVAILTMGVGFIELLPLLVLFFQGWTSRDFWAFAFPASLGIVLGFIFFKLTYRSEHSLSIRSGAVVVAVAWVAAVAIGALPFIIGGQLSPLDAVFESMSGWTTTGLTMLDLRGARAIYLFWRSFMQFAGGAGIAVLMLSAVIGPKASRLYEAEARNDRFLPSVIDTSRILLRLYLTYLLIGVLLYVTMGMSWFDAINHSMAALSTGGFSTFSESIGHWNSLPIEIVTIVLMILGATNFATHHALLQRKRLKVLLDNEFILFFFLISLSVPLIVYALISTFNLELAHTIRISLFQAVSALTTTGFQTISFPNWNESTIFLIVLLMIIGGGTGSTAGGIKLYRVSIVLKSIYWSVVYHLFPKSAVLRRSINKQGEIVLVNNEHLVEVLTYTFLYLLTYLTGVIIFMLCGFGLQESMFEFASALGTVGLSTGATGPGMPALAKIVQILGMWLGRLEFMAIILAITKLIKDLHFVNPGVKSTSFRQSGKS